MGGFCKLSNLLGAPDTGLHRFRIFDIAIIDVLLTIILALIIKTLVNRFAHIDISFWLYFICLLILSIILHRLFCVRTTIDKILFPN